MSRRGAGATPLVRARGVAKVFHDGTRELEVLRGIDLDLKAGESLAIVGASGCGKSTLLHLLGALDRPSGGTIELNGADVSGHAPAALASLRLGFVGFVFQQHHLLGEMTALENVMLPMLARRERRGAAAQRARELLERLGVADRATHRPAKLSGGEQQRVAIARALANEPHVLLADEPTGNLDESTGEQVADEIFAAAEGRGLIIVTHDRALAARAGSIRRLHEGRLEAADA